MQTQASLDTTAAEAEAQDSSARGGPQSRAGARQPDSHSKRKAARQPGLHESLTARRRWGARCPIHAQRSRALKLVQTGEGRQKESCAGQPDSHCKRKAARQPGQHESHTARRRRGARCPVHAQRSRALKLVQPGAGQKESCAGQPESPSSSKPVDVDGVMITSSVYDMPLGRPCMQPGCSGATIGFSAIWSWA